jgi:hypothetical protein
MLFNAKLCCLMLNYVVSSAAAQRPRVGLMYIQIKCKTSVPSSQRTQSATITYKNQLVLSKEINGIYRDNHTKQKSTVRGKTTEFLNITPGL